MWRLAVAVGIAGAGFCLVLAMVVLVVALGGGSHRPAPTRDPHEHLPERPVRRSPALIERRSCMSRARSPATARPAPYATALACWSLSFTAPGRCGATVPDYQSGKLGNFLAIPLPGGHPGDLTVYAGHAAPATAKAKVTVAASATATERNLPARPRSTTSNKKVPPGQAKKHKAKKHKAGKHKKKTPPGQAKKPPRKTSTAPTAWRRSPERPRPPGQPRHVLSQRPSRTRHVLVRQRSRRSHA